MIGVTNRAWMRLLYVARSSALLMSVMPILHAQFVLQDSGTTADLRGIANVGNGTAWASGAHGTVLRTEDSGFVWQGCAVPSGADQLDFRGIQAFDDQTAIVMSSGKGDLSRVYKTTDGCNTWKLVFTNPDAEGFFDAIQQRGKQVFYVLGDPVDHAFALWRSEDAGEHWKRMETDGLDADPMTAGAFAASNQSVVFAGARMYFGIGGTAGASVFEERAIESCDDCEDDPDARRDKSFWHAADSTLGQSSASAGVFALGFHRGHFVAVGGDYRKPDDRSQTASWSVDGTHWKPAQTTPLGYRSSVAYDAKKSMWITVGSNGTDVSTDEGKNWHTLKPGAGDEADADKHWNALSLPYVVGPHGRIGRLREDALAPPKSTHRPKDLHRLKNPR